MEKISPNLCLRKNFNYKIANQWYVNAITFSGLKFPD